MGRFYQTTQPHFIDNKMYEAPAELMANVLMNKEKAVDNTISGAVSFLDKMKAEVLTQDTPRLREKIKNYEDNINGIVDKIKANPLEYNKFQGDITKLGRDISSDWTTGEIGTMQKYKKSVAEEYDTIDKLSEKDGYDSNYKAARKQAILAKYKGIGWNQDAGTAGQSPSITGNYKALVFDEGFAAHMKDNGYDVTKETNGGNGYTYTKQGSSKGVSQERVMQAYINYIQSNPALQEAVNERRDLAIPGFENADLSKLVEYKKDAKGNDVFSGLRNDYYGNKVRSGITSYAHNETKSSDTIGNDVGYWKNKDYQREDAKEAKADAEHINMTYEHVYQVNANSAANFTNALNTVNDGMKQINGNLQDQIRQLKINPNSDTGRLMAKGNVQAMVAAGVPEATAYQLSADYKSTLTKRNFLMGQADGFKRYAKGTPAGKNIDFTKPGWLSTPAAKKAYTEYLGASANKNNVISNVVTFNDIGMSNATIKEVQGAVVQNFDDMYFNIDQTVKGANLQFDDAKGNTVVYVPANDKRAGKVMKVNTGKMTKGVDKGFFEWGFDVKPAPIYKSVTYKVAPEGRLSVGQLVKEGFIKTIPDPENPDKKTYITRENGKDVGMVLDDKTLGYDMSMANDGGSNLVMNVQMGDKRLPVLMSTKQLNVPSLTSYEQRTATERAFNRDISKTNISLLGQRTKEAGKGETFMTDGGRAFVIHADGSKSEFKTPQEIKRVHQIVYSEE